MMNHTSKGSAVTELGPGQHQHWPHVVFNNNIMWRGGWLDRSNCSGRYISYVSTRVFEDADIGPSLHQKSPIPVASHKALEPLKRRLTSAPAAGKRLKMPEIAIIHRWVPISEVSGASAMFIGQRESI